MAIINNTVQPGMINLAGSPNAKFLGGVSINPLGTTQGQLASSDPVFNSTPYAAPTGQISGLVSPAHPTVTPSTSTNQITSHTYTTNPDGSATTKISYAPNDSIGTATPNTTTTTPATNSQQNQPQITTIGNPYTPQLASTSAAGSPAAQGYTSILAGYGAGNIPIGQQAAAIAADYGRQIADVGQQGAGLMSGQRTTGTSPVAEGNAAITAQTTAAKQQALATGEEAALQGTSQQLTAQGQAATAANAAAGQALGQQQTVQSGLTSAGTLAQPSGTYPFVFNPTTGTFTNAQTGGIMNAQDAAQAVINHTMSYDQAKSALGYLGGTGEAQLQSAIQAAGGNALALQSQGSAQQQNILTGGTAQTGAYNTIYQNSTAAAATTATMQSQIRKVGGQALDLMKNDPNINKFALQFGNKTINSLQTQLSNPQYAAFNTAIQTLQARIASALQAGEIPSAATSNAQAIAQGNITLSALGSTLSQVDNELTAFVNTQNALSDFAKGQMGSGSGNSSVSSTAADFNSY